MGEKRISALTSAASILSSDFIALDRAAGSRRFSPDAITAFLATKTLTSLAVSGDVNVASGGLFYDQSENRVGVGTPTPSAQLHQSRAGGVFHFTTDESASLDEKLAVWTNAVGLFKLSFRKDDNTLDNAVFSCTRTAQVPQLFTITPPVRLAAHTSGLLVADGSGNISTTAETISSVFGRTGVVSAQSGDYTAAQITNFNSQALTAVEKANLAFGFSLDGGTTSKKLTVTQDVTLDQNVQGGSSCTWSACLFQASTPPIVVQRSTASTSGSVEGATVAVESTGQMVDGFGASIRLDVSDADTSAMPYALFSGVRDGVDNSSKVVLSSYRAGVKKDVLSITDIVAVESTSLPVIEGRRMTSSSSGTYCASGITAVSSQATIDTGFAVCQLFSVEDSVGKSSVGLITAAKTTADNTSQMTLSVYNGGATIPTLSIAPNSVNALKDLILSTGILQLVETTTPSAAIGFGKIYTKADNKLFFQDGMGSEHEIAFV